MSDVQRLVEAAKAVLDAFDEHAAGRRHYASEPIRDKLRAVLSAVEAQPPAAQGEGVSTAQMRELAQRLDVAIPHEEIECEGADALRSAADQLDAQASRIAALEGALRQAADLIAIPASYHEAELYRDAINITGGTRFSYGAQVHNEACATLLPVLRQALSGAAQ